MNPVELLTARLKQACHAQTVAAQPAATADTADAALAEREAAYSRDPNEATALAVLEARDHAQRCRYLATVIEAAGGPAQARWRTLHTPEVAAVFKEGFAQRGAKLAPLLSEARRAEAREVGELIADGLHPALAGVHPSLIPMRQRSEALAAQLQITIQNQNYVSQTPPVFDRSFDELFGALNAPIPA
jgi:hypothetical protein